MKSRNPFQIFFAAARPGRDLLRGFQRDPRAPRHDPQDLRLQKAGWQAENVLEIARLRPQRHRQTFDQNPVERLQDHRAVER